MSELRGDEATLYDHYHHELWRAVRRAVYGDDELIEDACSFAWTQLLVHQPDRGATLFAWLRTTAIREAWTVERRSRRKTPLLGADEHKHSPINAVVDPVDLDLQLESRGAARLLAELHPREARYLTLLIAGYSYREIQELDGGVSYTAVDRYISRARRKVREMRAQGRI